MSAPLPMDDYRPNGDFPALRTVCHGCRRVAQTHVDSADDPVRLRTLILPGDGTLLREVAPGQVSSAPCPVCGDGEDAGWLSGLVPPL